MSKPGFTILSLDHVPLQHFYRNAGTPNISYEKKAE